MPNYTKQFPHLSIPGQLCKVGSSKLVIFAILFGREENEKQSNTVPKSFLERLSKGKLYTLFAKHPWEHGYYLQLIDWKMGAVAEQWLDESQEENSQITIEFLSSYINKPLGEENKNILYWVLFQEFRGVFIKLKKKKGEQNSNWT